MSRLGGVLCGAVLLLLGGAARGAPPGSRIAFATAGADVGAVDIATVSPDGTGYRNVTHDSTGGSRPVWSADGRWLSYISSGEWHVANWRVGSDLRDRLHVPGGEYDVLSPDETRIAVLADHGIEIRDVYGRLIRMLRIRFRGDESYLNPPKWSPDGRWIAVDLDTETDNSDLAHIWIARTDGSVPGRRLSRSTNEFSVAFSPDSRWLLSDAGRMMLTSPATGERRAASSGINASAAWLPDAHRVMYARSDGTLVVADVNDRRADVLAHTGSTDRRYATSVYPAPVGGAVAFTDKQGLFVIPRAGRKRIRLAACGGCVPSWRPDGAELAFGDGGSVVGVNVRSLRRRVLVPGPLAAASPAWAPDRTRIAFVRGVRGVDTSDPPGSPGVYTIRADGTGLRRVGRGDEPAWAPDSRRLAYVDRGTATSLLGEYRAGQIYVDVPVGPPHAVAFGVAPQWSPDGHSLAFLHHRNVVYHDDEGTRYAGPVSSRLEVVDANGGRPRVVLDGPVLSNPRWSPDGRTVAAVADPLAYDRESRTWISNGAHVVLIDVATGAMHVVDDGAGLLAWAPDGTLLHATDDEVRVIDSHGARAIVELATGVTVSSLSWSPDSKQFAFTRCVDGHACDVWAATSAGESQHRVVHTAGFDGAVSWSH